MYQHDIITGTGSNLNIELYETAYPENSVVRSDYRLFYSRDAFAKNKILISENPGSKVNFSIKNICQRKVIVKLYKYDSSEVEYVELLPDAEQDFVKTIDEARFKKDWICDYGYDYDNDGILDPEEIFSTIDIYGITKPEIETSIHNVGGWVDAPVILSLLGDEIYSKWIKGGWDENYSNEGDEYKPVNKNAPREKIVELNNEYHLLTHKFGSAFNAIERIDCTDPDGEIHENLKVSVAKLQHYIWEENGHASLLVMEHSAVAATFKEYILDLDKDTVKNWYDSSQNPPFLNDGFPGIPFKRVSRDVSITSSTLDVGANFSRGLGRIEYYGSLSFDVGYHPHLEAIIIIFDNGVSLTGSFVDIFDFNYFNPDLLPQITSASKYASSVQKTKTVPTVTGLEEGVGEIMFFEFPVKEGIILENDDVLIVQ
jgi:hypothetical protein